MPRQVASIVRGSVLCSRVLSLAEDRLDRIEIGRVARQEEQLGAGGADQLPDGLAFVAAEVVHDDDIAGTKRRKEHLLDVEAETLAIDRPLEKPRRLNPIMAQGGQERHCLPAAVRNLGGEPLAARCPPPQGRHIGPGPSLVDEDQALRFDAILVFDPLSSPPGHVGTIAFASRHAFF